MTKLWEHECEGICILVSSSQPKTRFFEQKIVFELSITQFHKRVSFMNAINQKFNEEGCMGWNFFHRKSRRTSDRKNEAAFQCLQENSLMYTSMIYQKCQEGMILSCSSNLLYESFWRCPLAGNAWSTIKVGFFPHPTIGKFPKVRRRLGKDSDQYGIKYSSIMERAIRNPRNNRSVIETETNEDSQEAETKNGGPRKYRRRYKGAGEIIKEAKDETNTKKVMSTPMRAKSEKRRANASLRLRPNIKETVKLSQQTLIVSYYTILPFKTQLYNRMQNASNTQ
eukprot:TRINITY_DN764_c0_g1_i2.p1 TRINITY_DN764_c0_g1~~TRINITY_DN764_c0_g1_i2.p1  ORF type:complete len:294 (+),score=-9.81 TRINITY_DN764_c0_g1_i2:37-882(+)